MLIFEGSGCDSVGRTVASYTRVLQFNSYHRQILFTINCIKKTKIQKKHNYFQFLRVSIPRLKVAAFYLNFQTWSITTTTTTRRVALWNCHKRFECLPIAKPCVYLLAHLPTYIEREKHSLRWGQFKTFKHDLKFFNLHTTYLALVTEIS